MKKFQAALSVAMISLGLLGSAAFADINGNWSTSSSFANVQLSATIPQLIRLTVFDAGSSTPSTLSVNGSVDGASGMTLPNLVINGKVESNMSGLTVTVNNGGVVLLKKSTSDSSGITYTFPANASGLSNNSAFTFTGTPSGFSSTTPVGNYAGTVMLTAAKI